MRVCVATPEYHSPAARAMRMEAIGVEEWLCEGPLHYGRAFAAAWSEPFILCEWDVVPWPGAIKLLWDCPQPWCIHRYPIGRGMQQWTPALGIGKYRPAGKPPLELRETPWQLVDGVVVPWLMETFGEPHVHEPPVAHPKLGAR